MEKYYLNKIRLEKRSINYNYLLFITDVHCSLLHKQHIAQREAIFFYFPLAFELTSIFACIRF